jgi:hypothetical protein
MNFNEKTVEELMERRTAIAAEIDAPEATWTPWSPRPALSTMNWSAGRPRKPSARKPVTPFPAARAK